MKRSKFSEAQIAFVLKQADFENDCCLSQVSEPSGRDTRYPPLEQVSDAVRRIFAKLLHAGRRRSH